METTVFLKVTVVESHWFDMNQFSNWQTKTQAVYQILNMYMLEEGMLAIWDSA